MKEVPVYLHWDGSQTTWAGMNIGGVEANIQAAINSWWEEGLSNIRPYYAGKTTSTTAAGRIVMRELDSSCGVCPEHSRACEVTFKLWPGDERIGSTLWFKTASCGASYDENPITEPAVGDRAFRWVVEHELGHSLGVDHPNQAGGSCPGGGAIDEDLIAVLMSSPTAYGDYSLRSDDQWGLFSLYGPKKRKLEKWSSEVLEAWSLDATFSRDAFIRPLSGGLAMNPELFVGSPGYIPFLVPYYTEVVRDTSGTLAVFRPDVGGGTRQPVAVANGPTDADLLVAWTRWTSANIGCADGKIAVSRNGGSSWTTVDANPGDNVCSVGGPTATYDPVQGYYVVLWDEKTGTGIHYVTYDLDGDVVFVGGTGGGSPKRPSVHTPSIECSNSGLLDNCLVAWDAIDPFGCLTFEQTRLLPTGELVNNPDTPWCYRQETTPDLVYREDSALRNWGIVLKQRESLYTLRRDDYGGSWTDLRVVVTDTNNGVLSGAFKARKRLLVGIGFDWTYYVYTARTP